MKRFFDWFNNLYPVWLVSLAVIAFFKPPVMLWFNSDWVFWSLAASMLGMGLTLSLDDFKAIGRMPGSVALGFICASSAAPIWWWLAGVYGSTSTRWSAAIDRSSPAAGLELATGTPVIAIGGFGGSDPAPTLQQFQTYVANHEVAYYIVSDSKGHWGAEAHNDIADWVSAHFSPMKVGSDTVYNLMAPAKT